MRCEGLTIELKMVFLYRKHISRPGVIIFQAKTSIAHARSNSFDSLGFWRSNRVRLYIQYTYFPTTTVVLLHVRTIISAGEIQCLPAKSRIYSWKHERLLKFTSSHKSFMVFEFPDCDTIFHLSSYIDFVLDFSWSFSKLEEVFYSIWVPRLWCKVFY